MREVKVPPMLQALVQSGFSAVEGKEFSGLEACPVCGGEVSGYDRKERKFVTLIEDGGQEKDIRVTVRRFSCKACGVISPARAPFYPDTRVGSPVADLCVVLSRTRTPGRTVALLRALGIAVDRGTVRNLASRDFGDIPLTEMFGFVLPRSVISLSMVAFRDL
jgi:hypothetical protein